MSSTSEWRPPELADDRVHLRAPNASDLSLLIEEFADPETRRWSSLHDSFDAEYGALSYLRKAERDAARAGGPLHWAIELRTEANRSYAGHIDLHPQDRGGAGIDFTLHPRARGQHAMTAAIRLVCRWWFDHGGTHVTWFSEAGNTASWHAVRACGFRFGTPVTVYLPPPTGPVEGWVATLRANELSGARERHAAGAESGNRGTDDGAHR